MSGIYPEKSRIHCVSHREFRNSWERYRKYRNVCGLHRKSVRIAY